MTDVLPVLVVSPDQHLIVQPVRWHGHWGHVGRKLKKYRKALHAYKSKSSGQGCRQVIVTKARDYKSPLTKGRNIDMIRVRPEPRLLECFGDAPEGVAREHRRGTLDNHQTLSAQVAGCS